MTRLSSVDGQAGATILEVLITLVVLTLLISVTVLAVPQDRGTSDAASSDRVLEFFQSARATAIATGNPIWLSVSPGNLTDGSTTLRLAAGTLTQEGTNDPIVNDLRLLVRADGLIVGPRLQLATQTGVRSLFIWQPRPGGTP
jgi:Tfp pilus assembly protein FimT